MKQIPYHNNPGNACALACYTMVAQYLLPKANVTFEQLGKIADWHPGYVVWEAPVFVWLMNQDVHITDHDVIDLNAWATEGFAGLQKTIPPDEFKWYQENTYDFDGLTDDIKAMATHPNFTYIQHKPTWEDIVTEAAKPGICDLTLNSLALNHKEGFEVHRVILIEVSDEEVVFHDPNKDGSGAYRRESVAHFRKALEAIESPCLVRYSLGGPVV
jgi:hypothetical protein